MRDSLANHCRDLRVMDEASQCDARFGNGRDVFSFGCPLASRFRFYPLDILSAGWAGLEWIRKILRFTRNRVAPELHDAYGVGWLVVIRQDEFGDPKVTCANDSLDSKALPVRLDRAGNLYVAAAEYSLA